MKFIKFLSEITYKDLNIVGGKTASLGQMINGLTKYGIKIPLGFAITTAGYWYYLEHNNLKDTIQSLLNQLKQESDINQLQIISAKIRELIINAQFPTDLINEITESYNLLSKQYNQTNLDVAIRSSATAEDLPTASFAGQQETYLNISKIENVLEACKNCMASLFTDRAIVYRIAHGFNHFKIGISVTIQKMVRSDKASSGVIFTLDTETGFKDIVIINSSYGLGENIVNGSVNPDEFQVYKPTLELVYKPITKKYLGTKDHELIYSSEGTPPAQKSSVVNIAVDSKRQKKFSLEDSEILELARQAIIIENYYSELFEKWSPMDIEWAKDGLDNQLYIVQARPETVHSNKKKDQLELYKLKTNNSLQILATGQSIGNKIAPGIAKKLLSINDNIVFNQGDILVTNMTNPDWLPIIKKASAIITDQGGRTCHAAIVSRELGIPAVIGTNNGTSIINDGQLVTVDCSHGSTGFVYNGKIDYELKKIKFETLPKPKVPILLNISEPDKAFELSFLPVSGVGLARLEFIIANNIKIHPMAICKFNKLEAKLQEQISQISSAYSNPKEFFIETLAQSIATIAAAFYPKPVTVRFSDFKSSEYRNLKGGEIFEPIEDNPMIGFRGAVRYYSKDYAPAFALECEAIKRVRNIMGLTNVDLLIPFVRTLADAKNTLTALQANGLKRHSPDNLKILMMCEIPSNVILFEDFAKYFDGFSIGSNDLTQFTLAVDRDSAKLAELFDERDPAVLKMFEILLQKAKNLGSYVSICGQAPSDYPEIAEFLIHEGINAISLNSDAVIPFLINLKK